MFRIGFVFIMVVQVAGILLLAIPSFAAAKSTKGAVVLPGANPKMVSVETPVQNLKTEVSPVVKPNESSWGLVSTIGRTNSLYVPEGETGSASVDFSVSPSVKLGPDYTLSGLVEASQDLNAREFDYGRALIGLKKSSGFELIGNRVKLFPSFSISLPASKAAKAASLKFGATAGGKFTINPDSFFSKKLGLSFNLSLSRNVHEYETDLSPEGKVNTLYSSRQGFAVSWSLLDWLSLSSEFNHYNTLSYANVAKDYLSHSEEIGIEANKTVSFALGHAWGNPYVETRMYGQDIYFQLQDEENSFVYFNLILSI